MTNWNILAAAGTILAGLAGALFAVEPGYPPQAGLDDVRSRIDAVGATHPRLLATGDQLRALRERVRVDASRGELAQAVIDQAQAWDTVPPVVHQLQGRRLLGESRRCLKRVLYLSMAYHLTGESRYADRCEQEMLAVARFPDWNPNHFLDVAEMAFGVAIGYDWLYDALPESSREEIREALVSKALAVPFTTRHNGWVDNTSNWGQVCHGGLTAAALAVADHEPELAARIMYQAAHHVTRSMAGFAPHGSYPEGPGYWSYGTTYAVLLMAALEDALGTDFGLSQAPGFAETGGYLGLVTGPSGRLFTYADSGSERHAEPALYWLAQHFQRPDWLRAEPALLQAEIDHLHRRISNDSRDRFLPLVLLWADTTTPDVPVRMPLHWSSGGPTPITVHRSAWDDPIATFVGLKAGSPSYNHGHMDIGSFVLDAGGVRWAIDLPPENYYGIESRGMQLWDRGQDSDRWTIFRLNNLGHNTLVIDGALQRAAGRGRIAQFSDDPARPFSVADLSDVYAGQATSVIRGIALLPSRAVLIQDELCGLRPGSRVRWGMITTARPDDADGAGIALHQGHTSLTLSRLAPDDATWQIVDTAAPRNAWDSPNPDTRMVAFEAIAPADGNLTLGVLATPKGIPIAIEEQRPLRPLAEWTGLHQQHTARR